MDNVDIYAHAEILAETYPDDALSIAYNDFDRMVYTDTPEKLAAANALIAHYS